MSCVYVSCFLLEICFQIGNCRCAGPTICSWSISLVLHLQSQAILKTIKIPKIAKHTNKSQGIELKPHNLQSVTILWPICMLSMLIAQQSTAGKQPLVYFEKKARCQIVKLENVINRL